MQFFNVLKINRWQAFFVHLAVSAVVFVALLAVIMCVWYPGVFIHAGGIDGIKIVAGVDFVLGPLLTLIVFNPLKKSLKSDLIIVASIQFCCLSAGVWFVYHERPVVQIFSDSRVHVLSSADFAQFQLDISELKSYEGSYPKKIYLDLPDSMSQIAQIKITTELAELRPISYRMDLYRSLNSDAAHALKWRLDKLVFNSELECWQVEIDSSHFNGYGCLALEHGLISLKKEK